MALIERKTDPTPHEVRWFAGLWLPLAAAIVAALVGWQTGSRAVPIAILAAGVGAGVVGLLAPKAGRAILIGWMYATYPIGWVVSHALLAVIYFGVMTPIGLVRRLVRRDPLELRLDRKRASYWVERRRVEDVEAYFRRF